MFGSPLTWTRQPLHVLPELVQHILREYLYLWNSAKQCFPKKCYPPARFASAHTTFILYNNNIMYITNGQRLSGAAVCNDVHGGGNGPCDIKLNAVTAVSRVTSDIAWISARRRRHYDCLPLLYCTLRSRESYSLSSRRVYKLLRLFS